MTDDAQPLAEQCGTSAHATEALLYNRQEQKIKHPAQAAGRNQGEEGDGHGVSFDAGLTGPFGTSPCVRGKVRRGLRGQNGCPERLQRQAQRPAAAAEAALPAQPPAAAWRSK